MQAGITHQGAAIFAANRARGAVRFDVASVALGPRGPEVELFEDAF